MAISIPKVTLHSPSEWSPEQKKIFWRKNTTRFHFSTEKGSLDQISRMVAGRVLSNKDSRVLSNKDSSDYTKPPLSWWERRTCFVVPLNILIPGKKKGTVEENSGEAVININSFVKWMFKKGEKGRGEFEKSAHTFRKATNERDEAQEAFDKVKSLKNSDAKFIKAQTRLRNAEDAYEKALEDIQGRMALVVDKRIIDSQKENKDDLSSKKIEPISASSTPTQAARAQKITSQIWHPLQKLETLGALKKEMELSIHHWDNTLRDLNSYAIEASLAKKVDFRSLFDSQQQNILDSFEAGELIEDYSGKEGELVEKMRQILDLLMKGLLESGLMDENEHFASDLIKEAYTAAVKAERHTLDIENCIKQGTPLPPLGNQAVVESFKEVIKEATAYLPELKGTAHGELQLAQKRLLDFAKEGIDSKKNWRMQMDQVVDDLRVLLVRMEHAKRLSDGDIEFVGQGSEPLAQVYHKALEEYTALKKRVRQDLAIEEGKAQSSTMKKTVPSHPKDELGRKLGTAELLMKELTPKLIAEMRRQPLSTRASEVIVELLKMENSSILSQKEDDWKAKDGAAEKWLDLITEGLSLAGQVKSGTKMVVGKLREEFSQVMAAYDEARRVEMELEGEAFKLKANSVAQQVYLIVSLRTEMKRLVAAILKEEPTFSIGVKKALKEKGINEASETPEGTETFFTQLEQALVKHRMASEEDGKIQIKYPGIKAAYEQAKLAYNGLYPESVHAEVPVDPQQGLHQTLNQELYHLDHALKRLIEVADAKGGDMLDSLMGTGGAFSDALGRNLGFLSNDRRALRGFLATPLSVAALDQNGVEGRPLQFLKLVEHGIVGSGQGKKVNNGVEISDEILADAYAKAVDAYNRALRVEQKIKGGDPDRVEEALKELNESINILATIVKVDVRIQDSLSQGILNGLLKWETFGLQSSEWKKVANAGRFVGVVDLPGQTNREKLQNAQEIVKVIEKGAIQAGIARKVKNKEGKIYLEFIPGEGALNHRYNQALRKCQQFAKVIGEVQPAEISVKPDLTPEQQLEKSLKRVVKLALQQKMPPDPQGRLPFLKKDFQKFMREGLGSKDPRQRAFKIFENLDELCVALGLAEWQKEQNEEMDLGFKVEPLNEEQRELLNAAVPNMKDLWDRKDVKKKEEVNHALIDFKDWNSEIGQAYAAVIDDFMKLSNQ